MSDFGRLYLLQAYKDDSGLGRLLADRMRLTDEETSDLLGRLWQIDVRSQEVVNCAVRNYYHSLSMPANS